MGLRVNFGQIYLVSLFLFFSLSLAVFFPPELPKYSSWWSANEANQSAWSCQEGPAIELASVNRPRRLPLL